MTVPAVLKNRNLLGVSLSVGISFVGVGMVVPIRVLYAQQHGASLAVIGAMASAFLLSNFLCQYPTGWVADRWGRKPLMVAGLACQSVLSLLYLVFTDPVAFVVLRFLEGIASGAVLPPARALIADTISDEGRGQAYGIFGAFFNAGFLLGPALGGALGSFGFAPAFLGSFIFRLVATGLVVFLIHDTGRATPEARARAKAVPWSHLFSRALLGPYILFFGDQLFFGFDLTLMPLWLRYHVGAPISAIGLVYALWSLPNVLLAPLGGRLADRARRSTVIIVFGLLQVPAYVAYGLVTALVPVLVIAVAQGTVYILMQPSVDAQLAAVSPPDARARVQSVYSALGQMSAFISANTLTLLYGINYRVPIFTLAVCFGLSVVIGGSLMRSTDGSVTSSMSGAAAAE